MKSMFLANVLHSRLAFGKHFETISKGIADPHIEMVRCADTLLQFCYRCEIKREKTFLAQVCYLCEIRRQVWCQRYSHPVPWDKTFALTNLHKTRRVPPRHFNSDHCHINPHIPNCTLHISLSLLVSLATSLSLSLSLSLSAPFSPVPFLLCCFSFLCHCYFIFLLFFPKALDKVVGGSA